MSPSIVSSFNSAALIASATAVGLPKLEDGKGSCDDFPPLFGDAVRDAFAAVFRVRRTRQRVYAKDVLAALAAKILAAAEAGRIFFVTYVVQGTEPLRRVHSARVVDDQWHSRGHDLLKGFVHCLRDPVGTDDCAGVLAQRRANEFGGVRAEVVVGLRDQAMSLTRQLARRPFRRRRRPSSLSTRTGRPLCRR